MPLILKDTTAGAKRRPETDMLRAVSEYTSRSDHGGWSAYYSMLGGYCVLEKNTDGNAPQRATIPMCFCDADLERYAQRLRFKVASGE